MRANKQNPSPKPTGGRKVGWVAVGRSNEAKLPSRFSVEYENSSGSDLECANFTKKKQSYTSEELREISFDTIFATARSKIAKF